MVTHILSVHADGFPPKRIEILSNAWLDVLAVAILQAFGAKRVRRYLIHRGGEGEGQGLRYASWPSPAHADAEDVEDVMVQEALRRVGESLSLVTVSGSPRLYHVTFAARGQSGLTDPPFTVGDWVD